MTEEMKIWMMSTVLWGAIVMVLLFIWLLLSGAGVEMMVVRWLI